MLTANGPDMSQILDLDPRLSTDRLLLVPLGGEHAEDLFSVLSDPLLYEYTQEDPPASIAALRTRYEFLESRSSPDGTEAWLNWVLVESTTGMAIGYVQATVRSTGADVAWVVGTLWQRRGFATEAVQAMLLWLRCAGVSEFRATIHPSHTASQRVAAHAGFAPSGEMAGDEVVWLCGA